MKKTPYTLSLVIVLLMAGQAIMGLMYPALYRDLGYAGETWFGNDLITLLLSAPLLLFGLFLVRRGYVLGRLLWLGALGYGLYNYAFYLFGAALNVFLPLYIATFLLSAMTLALVLYRTDANEVAACFSPKTPVRLIGGYLIFIAVGLTVVWMFMWAAHVFAGKPTPVETEAFKLVAALDLTLMVPALAFGGIMLWRRRPFGYLIASIAGIQGSLYLMVLALNGALFIARNLTKAPGELPVWGTLALVTSAVTALLLINVKGHYNG